MLRFLKSSTPSSDAPLPLIYKAETNRQRRPHLHRFIFELLTSLVATLIAGALYAWQPWQNEGGLPTTFEPGSKTNAMLHASQTINPAAIRRMAIESQAGQSAYSTVIFGDSIVEFAALETLCGAPVLNAGVAGAKIDDLKRFAPSIVQSSKAKTVIIAVGVNDAARQIETTTASFTNSYRRLIQSLNHLGAFVTIATIAPLGEKLAIGRGPYDPTHLADLNSQILLLADEFRLPVVHFSGLPKALSGALQPELTTDGVHLTAAGYEEWLSVLSRSVCRNAARRQ